LVLVADHALHRAAIGGHGDGDLDGSGPRHRQTVGEHVGFTGAGALYVSFSRQPSEAQNVVVRRHVSGGQLVGIPRHGAKSASPVRREAEADSGHVRLAGSFGDDS
jgi:hypothetical protein